MNLLICTQKIDKNDPILGFFHRWVEEFAKHCEQIVVICLQKGEYHLPNNVKVLSLGKENGISKIKYLWNFYKYILREWENYDSVFVHMNQVYVILGGLFWRIINKKIGLWYAHGKVSLSLRLAEKLANIIFSSTASGFRLQSQKLKIVGQGIDTDFFKPFSKEKDNDILNLITVGRISPVKKLEVILEAIKILKDKINLKLLVIGGPGSNKDLKYVDQIQNLIKDYQIEQMVEFLGPKTQAELLPYLQQADLFVSASETGSLDKVLLESMSCGIPVALTNRKLVLPESFLYQDVNGLVEIINNLKVSTFQKEAVHKYVVTNHDVAVLINKIYFTYGG